MNAYFVAAAVLIVLLVLAHSVIGELLLISRLSSSHLPRLAPFALFEAPKLGLVGNPDLALATLRFTWHLASVLGLAFSAILLWLSLSGPRTDLGFLQQTMAISFGVCSLIVLLCTQGRHPGWVAFAAIAILTWLA
jgi:hypothetical protein